MKNKHVVSYAQNREDIIIDAFFDGKGSGFYVDVGANHPVHDSVTKFFYNKGWRGINFEPNTKLIKLLEADRPRDLNVAKGVGSRVETRRFREYVDSSGLSTFSDETINEEGENKYFDKLKEKYIDHSLEITTLEVELKRYKVDVIDFMKIDVEGMEYEVISGNNWRRYRPELLCIEANHLNKDWRPLLHEANYVKFFNDGLNDYFAPKESPLLKDFSYPEKVLMRNPFIDYFSPSVDRFNEDDLSLAQELEEVEEEERIPTKLKIAWSLIGLREALSEGVVDAIIRRKRRVIAWRLSGHDWSSTEDFNSLKYPVLDPKLFALRAGGILVSIGSKVSSLLLRMVRQ